jgi:hypothetical protein
MTTKLEVISQAFEEIGMADYVFDTTPEEQQGFLRRLNGMAAEWDGIGIRVGYSLGSDINAESGLPDTAVNCFATNLAIRMAPSFGKTPSVETKTAAKNGFNAMLVSRRIRPEVPYAGSLPIGTGSRRGPMEPQYFGDSTDVSGLNDGATEY